MQYVDESRISCLLPASVVAGTRYWFAVTVNTQGGVTNPPVTAVDSFYASGVPSLTSVCPPASSAVGTAQRITLLGTDLGTSTENVIVTLGPTGTELTCGQLQFVAASGGLVCIMPSTVPLGNIRFRISVRGQVSAVSSFTFYFAADAVLSSSASSAVIDSVSPSAPILPFTPNPVWTVFSSSGGFGQCQELMSGLWYINDLSSPTTTNYYYACQSFQSERHTTHSCIDSLRARFSLFL